MKTDILNFTRGTGKTVVALGKFDGIHIGHAKLLTNTYNAARELSCTAAMYIISGGRCNLADEQDMRVIAKDTGIDVIYTDVLTPAYMSMSPQEFVQNILVNRLGAVHVVVGYNYRFGKERCGNTELLKRECAKYNINVTVVDCVTANIGGEPVAVSSTEIRSRLMAGQIEAATAMLGRPYCIKGIVEHGRQLGRTIGFPTINFYPTGCVLPLKGGVYATRVTVGCESYDGITNIGINPTVGNNDALRVETHIMGFNKEIYGENARVEFLAFLRDEVKFDSLTQLALQLEADKTAAVAVFEKHRYN